MYFYFFFFKHNQKCCLQLHPLLSVEHVIALLFSVNQVVSKHFCSDALTDPGQAKEARALSCGHKLLVTGCGNTCAVPQFRLTFLGRTVFVLYSLSLSLSIWAAPLDSF